MFKKWSEHNRKRGILNNLEDEGPFTRENGCGRSEE